MYPTGHEIQVVPEPTSIADIRTRERVQEFIGEFQQRFGSAPHFVIRSPGRINLIGDHVDYHGFSVLPMAIENSILIGVSFDEDGRQSASTETGHIKVVNKASDIHKSFDGKHSFSYGSQLDKSHEWYHYVLCGYHGVMAHQLLQVQPEQVFKHAKELRESCRHDDDRIQSIKHNLNLFFDSDLPSASGLSSSSALVCASAIATHLFLIMEEATKVNVQPLTELNLSIDSKSMAANCAKFEHLIGTHGGGMDQAVIMTAQDGYAKHVEFMPEFKCTNVHLPENVVWLVSHCGSSYQKAATCEFNARVLETKLGAAIIMKRLAATTAGDLKLDHTLTLSQIKNQLFPSKTTSDICKFLREEVFHETEELGIDEICLILELSRQELIDKFKISDEFLVTKNGLDKRVKLLKRCLHVFQEAGRVEVFKLICDTTKDIHRLGKLMSESHASLRDQFDCSHPDLDHLVEVSLKAGALGARLTGAGWGGCIVSLAEVAKSEEVRAELAKVSKFTFQTEPRGGSTIIRARQ